MNACGLEVAMEDGTWQRLDGFKVVRGDAVTRPALHDLEVIPPHYARCRRCGETFVEDDVWAASRRETDGSDA